MTPADRETPKEPIKVVDRRSFTADGERRAPAEESRQEAPRPDEPTVEGEGFTMRPGEAAQSDFSALVVWLSSIAFINLGGVENPVSGKVELNLETARQMIDFLDILRERTRGNLDPAEARLLDRVFELKILYAQQVASQ